MSVIPRNNTKSRRLPENPLSNSNFSWATKKAWMIWSEGASSVLRKFDITSEVWIFFYNFEAMLILPVILIGYILIDTTIVSSLALTNPMRIKYCQCHQLLCCRLSSRSVSLPSKLRSMLSGKLRALSHHQPRVQRDISSFLKTVAFCRH